MGYAKHVAVKNVPQSQSVDNKQVKNSAGGYSFEVDCWSKLDRFLILGTDGGSYYANEKKMTINSANAVKECYTKDPRKTLDRIVEVSDKGLAAKNDPAIFALALCARDERIVEVLPKICRTATHMFQFTEAVNELGGWGRRIRRAVSSWYLTKSADDLAYQVCKYRNREGWTHKDVLRLCHAASKEETINNIMRWCVGKEVVNKHHYIKAFEDAQTTSNKNDIIRLIKDKGLVRECIPNTWFNDKDVWNALLENMPMTALIRNLPKLSQVGLLTPLSQTAIEIANKLTNDETLKRARIHPFKVLLALDSYRQGHNKNLTWSPCKEILEALDDAFYKSFQYVEPTKKRYLLALDVSGSMTWCKIMNSNLTPRDASGALAMVTLRTEPHCHTVAFSGDLQDVPLTKRQTLDNVIRTISSMRAGSTDCALPMIHALDKKIPVDVFVVYTDNETWYGKVHLHIALQEYRRKMNINSKLIVCGMVANNFTIADANDRNMLDVVGFSADVPDVMRSFVLE